MKCPDCDGLAHGKHKAHWFDPSKAAKPDKLVTPPKAQRKPALVTNARPMVANKVANRSLVANRSGDRHKDKAARRAYMRDYMAHRRHA